MVGDGATVAALMEQYASLGIDTFILAGYPHLEEAYHFAEHGFPRLALPRSAEEGRRGEVVANGAVRIRGSANAVPKPGRRWGSSARRGDEDRRA